MILLLPEPYGPVSAMFLILLFFIAQCSAFRYSFPFDWLDIELCLSRIKGLIEIVCDSIKGVFGAVWNYGF
jgi:hypothetical protein